ncbi:hypothetical protein HDU96_001343, partial [Phlyctochytrium bullatum]
MSSSINDLCTEVLLQIAWYLQPNELLVLASVCRFFRHRLNCHNLSLSFAKTHLKVHIQRTVLRDGWCPRWLHRLKAPVDYDHPMLFNYGIAAVALHGFTFSKKRHLGVLMLGWKWDSNHWNPNEVDQKEQRRRDLRVRMLAEALRLGLWDLEKLPTPTSLDWRCFHFVRYSARDVYGKSELEVIDAFAVAALFRSTELMQALIEKYTAEPFRTEAPALKKLFLVAANFRSLESVNFILATFAHTTLKTIGDPFDSVLVETCIERNFLDPIDRMDDYCDVLDSPYPLIHAIAYNHEAMVNLLLNKNHQAPPATALCTAAKRCHRIPNPRASMMRFFIEIGARLNEPIYIGPCYPYRYRDPSLRYRFREDWLPLHVAAWSGAEDVVDILLWYGRARRDPVDRDGYTPLMYACARNHVGVVEMLLKAGAKASYVVPKTGDNLLHLAGRNAGRTPERRYDARLVRLVWEADKRLLEHPNKEGKTPLDVARAVGRVDLRKLLGLPE